MNSSKTSVVSQFLCLLLLGVINLSFAQPAPVWIRTYDTNGSTDRFEDVYAVDNGGYVFCGNSTGRSWVVRTDSDGEALWSRLYPEDNNGAGEGRSIIETDEGNFLVGGVFNSSIFALLIDSDGETIWARTYGQGECNAVIELKEGNFVLCGKSSPQDTIRGYIATIAGDDGDVIWQTDIQHGNRPELFSLRETDGGIVTVGTFRPPASGTQSWLAKVDFDGDVIWIRDLIEDNGSLKLRGIVASPDGGFALTGHVLTPNIFRRIQHATLIKVNDRGFRQNMYRYDPGYPTPVFARSLISVPDVGYMLVGVHHGRDEIRSIAISTTPQGVLRWQAIHDFEELGIGSTDLRSVVIGHDGGIIAAGEGFHLDGNNNRNMDGVVIKLEPEQLEPVIFYWSPKDTLFSALLGDTTTFIVRARDQQGDEFSYAWIMDEDTLEHDSTITVIWDEVGDFLVRCLVSDGENISHIDWQVHVVDMYIYSHQPDSLNPSIRRNNTIDFSVTTRSVANDPVEYAWLLNNEQIADNDSVSIRFERGREHSVTAVASQGELSDSVTWQVMVNDLIVDYMPEQFDLSVPIDTSFEFELFPFNENDDSLKFLWTVNGDSVSSRSWLLMNFDEEGLYDIRVYVSDAVESDSLTWAITAQPNSVRTNKPRHPETTTLQPPTPNPFNSQTRIRYSLPIDGQIDLGLYDISGRRVETLYSGVRAAGVWSATLDGSELSSGVYFVGMSVGEQRLLQKVVLVK